MALTRVFISFDYDNDQELKTLLVGQGLNEDSPFVFSDWSIKAASPGWREDARRRIRSVDVVAVICGEHTRTALGVDTELRIAQEERVPYFLLGGRRDRTLQKPQSARPEDKIYKWTWENLKALIGGSR